RSGAADHALGERGLDHRGKDGDDVGNHGVFRPTNPSGGVITIVLAAMSMRLQNSSANGTSTSPRAPFTTSRGVPAPKCTSTTVPIVSCPTVSTRHPTRSWT